MKFAIFATVAVVLGVAPVHSAAVSGVHLSLSENHEVLVSWEEPVDVVGVLRYKAERGNEWRLGRTHRECSYVEETRIVHAAMDDLVEGEIYEYKISAGGEVFVRKFKGPKISKNEISVLIFADLGAGTDGDPTFKRIRKLVDDKFPDILVHVGDIGYADDAFLHDGAKALIRERYEDTWKSYMDKISTAGASEIPYMVAVGNHESECHSPYCLAHRRTLGERFRNFTAYNCRFPMHLGKDPSASQPHAMWHAFSAGPVGFVALNTETDFPGANEESFGDCHLCHLPAGGFGDYINWLRVTLAEYRRKYPWVVVIGHRPMILNAAGDCEAPALCDAQLDLINEFADVFVSGHIHGYARLFPKSKRGVVHLVNGGAGCDEWLERTITNEVETSESDKFSRLTFGASQSLAKFRASESELIIEGIKSETGEIFDRVIIQKSADVNAVVQDN